MKNQICLGGLMAAGALLVSGSLGSTPLIKPQSATSLQSAVDSTSLTSYQNEQARITSELRVKELDARLSLIRANFGVSLADIALTTAQSAQQIASSSASDEEIANLYNELNGIGGRIDALEASVVTEPVVVQPTMINTALTNTCSTTSYYNKYNLIY